MFAIPDVGIADHSFIQKRMSSYSAPGTLLGTRQSCEQLQSLHPSERERGRNNKQVPPSVIMSGGVETVKPTSRLRAQRMMGRKGVFEIMWSPTAS